MTSALSLAINKTSDTNHGHFRTFSTSINLCVNKYDLEENLLYCFAALDVTLWYKIGGVCKFSGFQQW